MILSNIINDFHPTDLTAPDVIKSTVKQLITAYLATHVKQAVDDAVNSINK